MSTTIVVCPSCDANLKVSAAIPAGKRIKCPKCAKIFAIPEMDEEPAVAVAAPPRKRKATAPPEEDHDAASQENEDRDEEFEDRPVKRKKAKKPKKSSNALYLIIGGVVLLVAVGVTLAIVFWPKDEKKDPVMVNRQPPGGGGPDGGRGRGPNDGDTGPHAAGKKVFNQNCMKCHSVGAATGGRPPLGGGGMGRGPSLAKIGADPTHTVQWLSEFVRNPQSKKPNARMRGFGEQQIKPDDLKALTEYLVTLK